VCEPHLSRGNDDEHARLRLVSRETLAMALEWIKPAFRVINEAELTSTATARKENRDYDVTDRLNINASSAFFSASVLRVLSLSQAERVSVRRRYDLALRPAQDWFFPGVFDPQAF
jgi:hypothetical protein